MAAAISTPEAMTGGAGTLLDLVWKLGGDEEAARESLRDGYSLTGNFRGHEADVIGDSQEPATAA